MPRSGGPRYDETHADAPDTTKPTPMTPPARAAVRRCSDPAAAVNPARIRFRSGNAAAECKQKADPFRRISLCFCSGSQARRHGGSIDLRDRTGVLHGVVPRIGDREVCTARAGEDLEGEGVGRGREERRREGHHPPLLGLLGRVARDVGHRVVDDRRVVGRHVPLDIGQTDVRRAVPDLDAEGRVHDLAHGTRGLLLHGLGVELEVARQHERVGELLVLGNAVRTAFLTHLAALLLGRQNLLLSDHGEGRRAQQQARDNDNDCFFHST